MTRLIRNLRNNVGPGKQKGLMGYVLGWLLGIPIPVLIIVAALRGCT